MTDMAPKKESILSRRSFIGNTVKLAVAGALIPAGMAQILPAIAPDSLAGGGPGPIILRDKRTNAKIPVTLSMLAGEPPVVVTAEYAFLPAVVYKVRKAALQGSSQRKGYNTGQFALQHPTEPDNVILVYEGKCKHLGCTVGWNGGFGEDYSETGSPDGRILCPCHLGQYDIYDLAVNIPGTPPPEPLNVVRFSIGTADIDGARTPNALLGVDKVVQSRHRDADQLGDNAPFALASDLEESA
jgi:Rieske Fe-S protein